MAPRVCNMAPILELLGGDTQNRGCVTLLEAMCHRVTWCVTTFSAYLSRGDGGDGDTTPIPKNQGRNKKYLEKEEKGKRGEHLWESG
jgi:hypothetical protein